MSKVIDLTDDSFDKVINSTDKPVIVDFYATWCGHCRSQAIILEKFANEFAGDVVVASVDVDENRQKANQYFISGIPAILVFKNGKLLEQKSGVHNEQELKKIVDKYNV